MLHFSLSLVNRLDETFYKVPFIVSSLRVHDFGAMRRLSWNETCHNEHVCCRVLIGGS